MLEKESFEVVDRLFDAALDLAPEERRGFLDRESPSEEIRAQVERLLESLDSGEVMPGGAMDGAFGDHVRRELESDSSITPGSSLGTYKIEGLLGAGGMGEVYRASDTRLRREVAIKVLPDDMSAPEQLERFDREARALAAVNHPHIGAIYGLEREDDRPYLVLELVPGTTLSERLDRGSLQVRKALAVAHQIAGALEAAHAAGIVHRDLKPANIKISDDSQVKILDFGLAKTELPSQRAGDDTATAATRTGVILGTAGYMSPEQARGVAVDRRADIWAFGCVLYEMLTGTRLFDGKTPSDTLAAVLREDPDWERLPAAVPESVRRLLRRCLTRDISRRLQHIGDARIVIEEWLEDPDSVVDAAPVAVRRQLVPWTVAAMALLFAGAIFFFRPEPAAPPLPLTLQVLPAPGTNFWTHYSTVVVVSPDGRSVAFAGREGDGPLQLYLRDLASTEVRRVEGSEEAHQPFFSPDGEWVGFFSERQLKKVRLSGGPVIPVAEVGGNSRGAAWGDGEIFFAQTQTSPLFRVSEDGGPIEAATELDPSRVERSHRWPQVLEGGQSVLYTAQLEGASFDDADLVVQDLATGERRTVMQRAGFGRMLPDGRLAFARAGRLYVARFLPGTFELDGSPEVALDGVGYDPRNGGTQFSIADNGTAVYRPGYPVEEESQPVILSRGGQFEPYGGEARVFSSARWSPDGARLAASTISVDGQDLWLIDRGRDQLTRLSYNGGIRPVWSPDGRYVVFASGDRARLDLHVIRPDGGGSSQPLLEGDNILLPCWWSADGRFVLYQERDPEQGWDLKILEVDVSGEMPVATGPPRCLRCTQFNEAEAVVSSDGRLVSYESDELDNVYQIYVQPFPAMGRKWQVSSGGARRPVFSQDSEAVYYWNTSRQSLESNTLAYDGVALRIGETQTHLRRDVDLWPVGTRGDPAAAGFQVTDEGRFLTLRPPTPSTAPLRRSDVVVALDWLARTGAPAR